MCGLAVRKPRRRGKFGRAHLLRGPGFRHLLAILRAEECRVTARILSREDMTSKILGPLEQEISVTVIGYLSRGRGGRRVHQGCGVAVEFLLDPIDR